MEKLRNSGNRDKVRDTLSFEDIQMFFRNLEEQSHRETKDFIKFSI